MKIKKLFFLIIMFGEIVTSCEKDTNAPSIIGKWLIYESCSKYFYVACIHYKDRNVREVVEFTKNRAVRYYNDSVVSSVSCTIKGDTIIYGQQKRYAQEFVIRNDTLTLTDTCLECNFFRYVRMK